MNADLVAYIEEKILPRYASFDRAHNLDHARWVITQSLALATHYAVREEMVYVIAAYHDTGLVEGREHHHLASGRILAADATLRRWFSEEELQTMREAVEDHRASSDHAPRSLYGRIVAEADRQIDLQTIVRRTVQYSLDHYPSLSCEEHYARCIEHLHEKYAEGGYRQLWIPESENASRLEALRAIIRDEGYLRSLFGAIFSEESGEK